MIETKPTLELIHITFGMLAGIGLMRCVEVFSEWYVRRYPK